MDNEFEVGEFYGNARDPYECPVCGDMHSTTSEVEVDFDTVYIHRVCDCGAMWTDMFEYSGFTYEGKEED